MNTLITQWSHKIPIQSCDMSKLRESKTHSRELVLRNSNHLRTLTRLNRLYPPYQYLWLNNMFMFRETSIWVGDYPEWFLMFDHQNNRENMFNELGSPSSHSKEHNITWLTCFPVLVEISAHAPSPEGNVRKNMFSLFGGLCEVLMISSPFLGNSIELPVLITISEL